ncbi:MAG: T9SS type A sorting domain-containing protein, partial [bacterium]
QLPRSGRGDGGDPLAGDLQGRHAGAGIPGSFVLEQNYPNPFNAVTVIRYQLPISSFVELSIYNINGKKVATLFKNQQPAGNHYYEWNENNLASGVYVYRLAAGGFVHMKKLILLK